MKSDTQLRQFLQDFIKMKIKKETCNNRDIIYNAKKDNAIFSGNAGEEINLHPGGRKKYFFISLIEFFK